MARLTYLTRRDGGRYYLQMRFGRSFRGPNAALLRLSLGTSRLAEARLILAAVLTWLIPLRDAGTLERREVQILDRLRDYNAKAPVFDRTTLQARLTYEYVARKLIDDQGRAAQSQAFNEAWMIFCNENHEAERRLQQLALSDAYERGRHDCLRAQELGFITPNARIHVSPSHRSRLAPLFDPLRPGASIVSTISGTGRDTAETVEDVWREKGPRGGVAPPPSATVGVVEFPQKPLLSVRLNEFLDEERQRNGDGRAEADVKPIVEFLIELVGDRPPDDYTREDFKQVDSALPDIPNRDDMPRAATLSLYQRYQYAQEKGWNGLTRLTETTIKDRFHSALNRFFNWLIAEGLYHGPKPKFSMIKSENLVSLPRDSFEDAEMIVIFSLALFTGCAGLTNIWQPGRYFIQNHLYWGYLILVFTGMRPGEIGQLKTTDIIEEGGLHFFDMRSFDAREGRVARSKVRQLKTTESARVIPIHPILIELGLLERVADLESIGESRLLPEWKPYKRPTGQVSWGYPLTKSFQYLKKKCAFKRKDLTLYAGRHLIAALLDAQGTPQRNRDRIMGHATSKGNASGTYGSKRMLTPEEAAVITKLDTPLIRELRKILLEAKKRVEAGELIVLKPWMAPKK